MSEENEPNARIPRSGERSWLPVALIVGAILALIIIAAIAGAR